MARKKGGCETLRFFSNKLAMDKGSTPLNRRRGRNIKRVFNRERPGESNSLNPNFPRRSLSDFRLGGSTFRGLASRCDCPNFQHNHKSKSAAIRSRLRRGRLGPLNCSTDTNLKKIFKEVETQKSRSAPRKLPRMANQTEASYIRGEDVDFLIGMLRAEGGREQYGICKGEWVSSSRAPSSICCRLKQNKMEKKRNFGPVKGPEKKKKEVGGKISDKGGRKDLPK